MKHKRNPLHQKETEFTGSFQAFSCPGLSPDDPEFKRRDREGRRRAANSIPAHPPKKNGRKKPGKK